MSLWELHTSRVKDGTELHALELVYGDVDVDMGHRSARAALSVCDSHNAAARSLSFAFCIEKHGREAFRSMGTAKNKLKHPKPRPRGMGESGKFMEYFTTCLSVLA